MFIFIKRRENLTVSVTVKLLIFFVCFKEVTAKGPQNLARKNFHRSMDLPMDFGETSRASSPAAGFKQKQGRYNLLKIVSEFVNLLPLRCLLKL